MTLLLRSTCLLVALLLLAGEGKAQEYIFKYRYYSVEDGLSSRFLTNVVQDDQGFIWIGSDFGVNRFDGQTFKKFNSNNSNLRANSRSYLFKDSNGKIWVNNERGQVDIIDPKTERITKLEHIYPELAGKSVQINRFGNGKLLSGSVNDTLFYFDGNIHTLPKIPKVINGEKPLETLLIAWDHVFRIYKSGLFEFNFEGKTLNKYPISGYFSRIRQMGDSILMLSYQLKPGNNASLLTPQLLCLTKGLKPNPKPLVEEGKTFSQVISSELWSVSNNQDNEGNTWLLIQDRLNVFDKNGQLIASLPKFEESSRQLSSETIFFDKDGQAWITGRMGIYVISIQKNGFKKFLQNQDGTEISVRGIAELSDKSLLACTYNGVYHINPYSKAVEKNVNATHYGVLQAKDGAIWFGTHSRKVIKTSLDQWGAKQEFVAHRLKSGGDEYLRLFEDPYSDNIFVGTRHHGLLIFNKEIQDFEPYPLHDPLQELSNSEPTFMLFKRECIWVSTNNGLYKMDREKGSWTRFNKFPHSFIYHFSEDKNGVFWLATRGGGLIRWDSNSGKTKQFNTETGLSSDILYAAFDDSLGCLWLPSNFGLMCFEKNTGKVYNYLPADGISHEEFNNTSFLRGSDGTFYFGSLNGITAVNPALISNRKRYAPLILTGFKILEGNQYVDGMPSFKELGEVVIRPGQQFFTLDFALQDFIGKKHSYTWQLHGIDENWTEQTENTVRFNALPYGDYVLKIKGESDGGGWSSDELVIPIRVIRPFYKTWKFAFLALALLALGTFYYIQWRIKRLRNEKQRLAELVDERTLELVNKNEELACLNQTKDRLFSIIAHDLRTPLVTLGGLARKVAFLIRQNRVQEVYQLGDSIEDSVASVRNLLDNLLKWSIVQDGRFPHHPEQLNMHELAEEVIALYLNVAETKGVSLKLVCGENATAFADRNGVSTIIRNLVDNAIKFCPEGGTAELKIENREQHCVLQVSNTGTGIPPEIMAHVFDIKFKKNSVGSKGEKGNGLGMALSRELVEINSGTISVSNCALGGAVFTVILPSSDALFQNIETV